MSPVLELKNVSKYFGKKEIYRDISYQFENGCHAICGPNGIGKTVLIEMIAGVITQTSGTIALKEVGSNTSQAYKQTLTYVPENNNFFPTATGADFLNFVLSAKKVHSQHAKLHQVIEGFKLNAYLNVLFKNMSLGTRRKFFLATLVIGNNSLIVMDEPTNGLDNQSINYLSSLISNLSKQKIFILTTHDDIFLSKIDPVLIKLKSPAPICDLKK